MAEQARARDTKSTLLRLWSYLRRQRRQLTVVATLVVLTTLPVVGRAIPDGPGD